ncbi:methyl-accepting chemotaxis protein [Curvivirga aplysinae]|uniref:methyl-accepting chemotaxis protein n=1 Tax=Curvivirga aplysinae TaxID=2529852 RepID=UPI001C3FD43C|nr:methyl-accepting chemotaxis protein [Curvivirga aplysinae]
MLGRLKISTKIGLTNVVLLALLLGIGGVGIISLQNTFEKFEEVRDLTHTTNSASKIQAEMLEIQVAVSDYLLVPIEENAIKVTQAIEALNAGIDSELVGHENSTTISMYEDLKAGLTQYGEAFILVQEKENQRQTLINVDLSSIGSNIETNVFALMDSISLEGDADLTFMAGESFSSFSTVTSLIKDFLANNDEASYEKAQKQIARFEKGFAKLDKQLEVKRMKGLVKKTNRDLKKYKEILETTRKTIAERNALMTGALRDGSHAVEAATLSLIEGFLNRQEEISVEAEDDINAATQISIIASIISAAMAVVLAYLLARGIAKPIVSMTESMVGLSEGDTSVEVPAKERKDEIGSMAQAVQVFKDNAIRVKQLEDQREAERVQAEAEKKRLMSELADDFEANVGHIVDVVSGRSSEMRNIAQSLSGISDETSSRAGVVATTAEGVSNDIQTVASAAEELSYSVQEINSQVERSSAISEEAVQNAEKASERVGGLEETADKVSNVIQLINEIAEQTNLLALNATIEAARAGDAGKGFAVVANEVKSLATQTARATEEISTQINDMQSATDEVVEAIKGISDSIEQMNSISSMVAGAVVQQGAATQEIARNVQGVSAGTHEVSSVISDMSVSAEKSGSESQVALSAAEELSSQADRLKSELTKFLNQIRLG